MTIQSAGVADVLVLLIVQFHNVSEHQFAHDEAGWMLLFSLIIIDR